MFDWFRKKKPAEPLSVDRVWVSMAARDRALVKAAVAGPIVVVAFFEQTLERVRATLTAGGCNAEVFLADRLGRGLAGRVIHLAERHPLPSANLALLERLVVEAPGVVPICHSALDEPLMLRFAGNRVALLIEALGVDPEEPIEHAMVSRALANAREKVAVKVGVVGAVGGSGRSMEEWLDLYMGPAETSG